MIKNAGLHKPVYFSMATEDLFKLVYIMKNVNKYMACEKMLTVVNLYSHSPIYMQRKNLSE